MVEFGLGGIAWPTGFPKAYIMPAVENGYNDLCLEDISFDPTYAGAGTTNAQQSYFMKRGLRPLFILMF